MSSTMNITDDEIIAAIKEWGGGHVMTYVLRNILSTGRQNLETGYIRRRLEKLEKAGKVKRTNDHPYARQIGWTTVEAPAL